MANAVAPRGFVPTRHLDGSPWNGQYTLFLIPSGDSNPTYVGDPIKWGGSAGAAGKVVNGMDCEGMPTGVSIATTTVISAGTSIAGVVVGFLVDPTDLTKKYRAASTDRIALVVTDPTVVYSIQEDAATTPLAAADVGLNASFTVTNPSNTAQVSATTIQSTSKATTSTLPLRLLGLTKVTGNAFNTGGAGTDPATFDVIFNATGNSFGGAGIAGS